MPEITLPVLCVVPVVLIAAATVVPACVVPVAVVCYTMQRVYTWKFLRPVVVVRKRHGNLHHETYYRKALEYQVVFHPAHDANVVKGERHLANLFAKDIRTASYILQK